jgi:hypothetical protein
MKAYVDGKVLEDVVEELFALRYRQYISLKILYPATTPVIIYKTA